MAAVRVDERADFTFAAGDLDTEALRVIRFRGTEGISQLSRFEIELTSSNPDVEFDDLVGEKGVLAWKGMEATRWVHGLVTRFELIGQGPKLTSYAARLVPGVWLLTRRHQSRIFQNLATPDILKQVFQKGGMPSDEVKLSLKRSYKPRKYCVQYRETDFDFVSRLMEEEGIFYFFEHGEDGHVLHVGDDLSTHAEIAGETTLFYRPGEGMVGAESIREFRYGRSVRQGLVTLRDFDFKKPSLDLTSESEADKWKELEHYDYPGDYPDKALGKDLAKIRLEEEQAHREQGDGGGDCRMMVPGSRFTLENHTRSALNQKYLITAVRHYGTQPQAGEEERAGAEEGEAPTYQNSFQVIPATVVFRPPRLTPRPRVEGPQTAVVTGPKGEEIHTDEYARVKVRFHWDRSGVSDDKSSCWVRVNQGWAGAGWGAVFIPRIGQEVVIEFLEGDPDRPLIMGRVYNGENPPPYDLPGAKTRSSIKSNTTPGGGGSNEIRFEDAAGGEEVYVHAQKDKNVVVENDHTRSVGHDETIHVKSNRAKTVDVDQSETIGSNKKIKVGSNHDETIGSNMTLNVGADCTESIGSNRTITIGSAKTETIAMAATITVGLARTLTVGAADTEMIGGSKSVTVGGSLSETVGGGASLSAGKDRSVKAGGNYSLSAGGAIAEKAGGDVTIQAGGAMALSAANAGGFSAKTIDVNAQDAIVIKVGSASIEMKKNGDILINGKTINVKGSSDIVLKGSSIKGN